jgi:hypothetical protein
MKSQFTPGPWLVRFDEDRFDSKLSVLEVIDGSDASLNHPQGELVLARVNVSAFAPHMGEPLANARLIASAPDLLASLVELESMVAEMLPKHGPCGWGELALNQARQAIAKATGNNA